MFYGWQRHVEDQTVFLYSSILLQLGWGYGEMRGIRRQGVATYRYFVSYVSQFSNFQREHRFAAAMF